MKNNKYKNYYSTVNEGIFKQKISHRGNVVDLQDVRRYTEEDEQVFQRLLDLSKRIPFGELISQNGGGYDKYYIHDVYFRIIGCFICNESQVKRYLEEWKERHGTEEAEIEVKNILLKFNLQDFDTYENWLLKKRGISLFEIADRQKNGTMEYETFMRLNQYYNGGRQNYNSRPNYNNRNRR